MNQYYQEDEDEDEDEDGDLVDYYGDLLSADQWEDHPAAKKLYDEMPKGWLMVKVIDFTARSFSEIETWLKENCRAQFKKVGFKSGCSYNVAVQFEDTVDAIMFKLRWR